MTPPIISKLPLRSRHHRLIGYIRGSWPQLAMAMVCMLVVAATTSTTAFLVKPMLDDIFMEKDETMLMIIPIALIVLYLLRAAAMYGQEFLMHYVGESIIRQLRDSLYDKISDLPLMFFQKEKTGVLMSRITNDVNIIKAMVSNAVTGALRDVFTIFGLIFVIFYQSWKLALIALIVLPVAFFPIAEFGRRIRRFSTRSQESMADLNAFLHETFAGNKIVKAFGTEAEEKSRFFEKNRTLFRYEVKTFRTKALTSPVMEVLGGVGVAVVIWYGGYAVINEQMTPGTFFSFMTALMLLYAPVKKLTRLNNAVQQGLAAADRIFDVLETEVDITDPAEPVALPKPPHRVAFANVSFGYSPDETVLKDICLEVRPGERLGIVGTSGGGKTSLVNLIPRFYDVTAGSVKIDGTDVRQLAVADLRSRIGLVTQEPILFNDTLGRNIAYGSPDATAAQVWEAAKAAYIADFINKLPKAMDTVIGELGSRLSGGEKQRICIARALLKDAPILILDEATSALDSEAEHLVQKALENLMQGRTSFVIAHRLSTIMGADRIIVLSGGRIAEQGTHADLLKQKGEYSRFYYQQFSDPVDTAGQKNPASR
ncbi:subfamily B ATP-binding cassette protein MsbA [Desulfosalsimonas propionicica]|uniref:Subfamily B ATP-binding cassette protein MsbA n=1 Tax=Desulfosalsimonas propionicica TaxID=332175 RepID=A0A7W0CBS2_9BACT|nr:ABC transporter ATP-binding protein [Desulfosalsimonas propionicica]MBA2882838.1 subfamily B ATP-binding cassette protein MsbA [Desulfosalsimonas propionicica]